MSFTNKDRKVRSDSGKEFSSGGGGGSLESSAFAVIVAEALRREYGGTGAAVKSVVAVTHANERAVKNWFSAKNAPDGPHLMALMRHSDEVFETFLLLAGRKEFLKRKKLSDFCKILERIRKLMSDLDE